MSDIGDQFVQCMHAKGLPVPTVEDLEQARRISDALFQAWQDAGAETQMTIGALVVIAGAALGVEIVAALAEAGEILVEVYLEACIACLARAPLDALKGIFASNAPLPYMAKGLADNGIDFSEGQSAVA